ncbi:MAG: MFS transporter, partial [Synechococcus sp.]
MQQFPAPLRELTLLRLIGSLGAGGVLYLTPMVFHQADLGPTGVTQGVALAALAGTAGRLLCGLLLDRGLNCGVPVLLALLCSLLGDGILLGAFHFPAYLLGQALLGLSMGFYWPAIELAVALSCAPVPSARAFALVRTADAAGIVAGALVGTALAWGSHLRAIYLVDITCLAGMALLLLLRPLPDPRPRSRSGPAGAWRGWLPPLVPLLAVAVLATAMPALLQSALPLELVRGGLRRPPLPEAGGALLIGLQLILLLL